MAGCEPGITELIAAPWFLRFALGDAARASTSSIASSIATALHTHTNLSHIQPLTNLSLAHTHARLYPAHSFTISHSHTRSQPLTLTDFLEVLVV